MSSRATLHTFRTVLIAFVLLLTGTPRRTVAQSASSTGFGFLQLDPSARTAALAGAVSAAPGDDAGLFFTNPALLNESLDHGISLSYLNHLHDVRAGMIAYARNVGSKSTMAVGIRYLGWGGVQGADEQGELTENFGASDVALTLGLGRAYGDNLRYGVSLHAIRSSVESYSASALAADIGITYWAPGPRFGVSASVNNLGVVLNSLGNTTDELPLNIRVSVSKRLRYMPLLVSITASNLDQPGETVEQDVQTSEAILQHFAAGGEFQFSDAFNVRVGYNHHRHHALATKSRLDLAGLSAGFGLKVSRVRFDYAFSTWSSAGSLHMLTVRAKV